MTQEHPPMPDQQLIDMLLALVPVDGSTVGNTALKRALDEMLKAEGKQLNEDDYWRVQASLVASSTLSKGQGRGGSVRRTDITAPSSHLNALTDGKDSFVLEAQDKPVTAENTQNLHSAANLLIYKYKIRGRNFAHTKTHYMHFFHNSTESASDKTSQDFGRTAAATPA